MLGLFIVGIGPLAFFAWFNKLGDFAKSPQTVEMNMGTTAFVAGGRARLWFAGDEMGPSVEVQCKRTSRLLQLTEEPSDEVCGIRVRLKNIKEQVRGRRAVLRGTFEVTWDDSDR